MRARLFVLLAATAAAFARATACTSFAGEDTPAGSDASADVGTVTAQVTCLTEAGDTRCAAGKACCLTWGQSLIFDQCVAPDAPPCSTGYPTTKVTCDEQADCTSPNVCCELESDAPKKFEAHCVAPAACSAPHRRMCASDGECAPGNKCLPIKIDGLTLFYKACQ